MLSVRFPQFLRICSSRAVLPLNVPNCQTPFERAQMNKAFLRRFFFCVVRVAGLTAEVSVLTATACTHCMLSGVTITGEPRFEEAVIL